MAGLGGVVGVLLGWLGYQVGTRDEEANANGSVHGKLAKIREEVVNKSAIKSIQKGYETYDGDRTSNKPNITITINEVNPDKCIVILNSTQTGLARVPSTDSATSYVYTPALYSLSATQLVVSFSGDFDGVGSNYYYNDFSWQVIEFY